MDLTVIVAENRMSHFVVGLTNQHPFVTAPVYKQYYHIQYNGALPAATTASVSFPPSDAKFRYVIIQQQFTDNEAICLSELKVFSRGNVIDCQITAQHKQSVTVKETVLGLWCLYAYVTQSYYE